MLSTPARVAARRATSAASNSFASTSTSLAQSDAPFKSDVAAHRQRRLELGPEYVCKRILRTAAYGSYELGTSKTGPREGKGYIAQMGYRPTPHRDNTELLRLGSKRKVGRGQLVDVVPSQVEASMRSRRDKNGAGLVRAPKQLGDVGPRRRYRGVIARPPVARGIQTSATTRLRMADESLASLDADLASADGGLWDDADFGEGAGGKGKGRVRDPQLGDYVEVSRNGNPTRGIYMTRASSTARRFILVAPSGVRFETSLEDVTYIIPELVPPSIAHAVLSAVQASSLEELWDTSAPEVVHALQALRRLETAVEVETQQLVARGAKDVFRLLQAPTLGAAKGKATRFAPPKSVTVATALASLGLPTGLMTPERRLAMHRILMSQPEYFLADEIALRSTGRFDLRAADEAERFVTVRDWVRHRTLELESWAEKCAKVRDWAREQRRAAPSLSSSDPLEVLPLPEGDAIFEWSATDHTIFAFLRDTLAGERLLQMQPHMGIAPLLLKAVDTASDRLGFAGWGGERDVRKARVRAFLAEVGVVAPWENWVAHERVTGLPEWDGTGRRVKRALKRGMASPPAKPKVKNGAGGGNNLLSSSEFYAADPHDAVRHDFGAATVYTIDDIGASELDDGISLAPGPASASGGRTWWVHVHVADPTALLHPGHLLAKLARVRDHTEYFPERTWAMLPDSFTVGNLLSLGALDGKEQRVLSLGVRIDEETGEIVENEVKAGVVRDVRRLTYGAVDKALGYTPPPKGRLLHSWAQADEVDVAPRRERPTDDALLESDPKALSDLRTLHALAGMLLKARVASSALFWQFPAASVSVSPKPLITHFRTSPSPTFYASAPRVSLQLPSEAAISGYVSHADSPAQLLVSEMMVAANRSAARFAVENSLAVPFRTQAAPSGSSADLEAVLALRNPATGQAPAVDVLKRNIDFLPGSTMATPGPHWPMGIDGTYGYSKVTSPLRRYSDLFAHYQLKSALLPSAAATSSAFAPRFSLAQVQAHIDGFTAASKARHRLDGAASAFWALWTLQPFLARLAVPTPAAAASALPSSASGDDAAALDLLDGGLTALALREPTYSSIENVHVQPVLIPQLGLRGTLQVDKAAQGAAVGEEVNVRIAECVLGARSKVLVVRR